MKNPDLSGIARGVCWLALGFVTYILVARAVSPEADCVLTGLCQMCPYENVCAPKLTGVGTSVSTPRNGPRVPKTQGDPR